MKKFILTILIFLLFSSIMGEIIVRSFKLVPDIPQRTIEPDFGIQVYKPGQKGFYTKAKEKWHVNEYGWMGVSKIEGSPLFSIIGDSYIENIMNPISSNQGYLLSSWLKNDGFFEAGRSGVTLIEALQITKLLDKEIHPDFHLIYINNNDFYESLTSYGRYPDRVQIDLENGQILNATMKSPGLKKILYNWKLAYYLYLRFPVFVSEQNRGETAGVQDMNKKKFNTQTFENLFGFIQNHYDMKKIIFVFHPGVQSEFINLANRYGFMNIPLEKDENESWQLGGHDGHWSPYGHKQAAKQVKKYIENIHENVKLVYE